ncbi:MAG: aspartate dehydrogenase [Betaproteobacteria bacterium]|nr:aspartate dehydrogenase [Betaproteobacteria bacterium]
MGEEKISIALIGLGAVGRAIFEHACREPGAGIRTVVVSEGRRAEAAAWINGRAEVRTDLPKDCDLALECAGHAALAQHIIPALSAGTECAMLSVGALATPGVAEQLEAAAHQGAARLHLLPGAIGGIDALSAARLAGLDAVTYTGRKPIAGWRGTAAETVLDLDSLREPEVILRASARDAARQYPKNANVAAAIALAGVGLDQTQVKLIADPTIQDNIHEFTARGAFGDMRITLAGRPLAENPKTSALTVLSALRFLRHRTPGICL